MSRDALPGYDAWLTEPDPEPLEPDDDEPADFNERRCEEHGR